MSGPLVGEVLASSRARLGARLVLVVLAEAVNERRLKAGEPPEAWLSQGKIASRAGICDRAVRRHLTELMRLGEIEDTGRRKGRGAVVWEIVPVGRTPASGVDASVRGENPEGGETEHVGRKRPPGRTDATADRTPASAVPRTPASTEPEVEPEVLEPEVIGTAANAAAALTPSFSREEEATAQTLEDTRAMLREENLTGKYRASLERHVADLKDELGTEAEISAMADELLGVAA